MCWRAAASAAACGIKSQPSPSAWPSVTADRATTSELLCKPSSRRQPEFRVFGEVSDVSMGWVTPMGAGGNPVRSHDYLWNSSSTSNAGGGAQRDSSTTQRSWRLSQLKYAPRSPSCSTARTVDRARLRELKPKYDPDDFFRHTKRISQSDLGTAA